MASYKAFVISGFFLVTVVLVIQSAPIEKSKEIVHSASINQKPAVDQHLEKLDDPEKSTTTKSTVTVSSDSLATTKTSEEKKKRDIDDEQLDGLLDYLANEADSSEMSDAKVDTNNKPKLILHAKIQETSAKIHDNADKPMDTDDSKIFSDIKMTPNELTNVVRRRRNVKLNDQVNQRRKRALSPYDFYDTDSLYEPYADLIERRPYVRPTRSFAPLYWYPPVYERSIRSALAPSFYEASEWPRSYSSTIDDDDTDDDDDDDDESVELPASIFDDENDYESNRYPILLDSSNDPYDNLQLQQQYNIDELPMNEDFDGYASEDDEDPYTSLYQNKRLYDTDYDSTETYF